MKRIFLALLLASLVGCASRETLFKPELTTSSAVDTPFVASGRLSVQMNGHGQVANFEWTHALASDQLSINTPIGTTVARLTRDKQGVSLESDGKTWRAPDVAALTEERLGWSLPLDNLVWWLRGRAAPGFPAIYAPDGSLEQQGWTIRFTRVGDGGGLYPQRVDLTRDNLTIRLVTYHWQ